MGYLIGPQASASLVSFIIDDISFAFDSSPRSATPPRTVLLLAYANSFFSQPETPLLEYISDRPTLSENAQKALWDPRISFLAKYPSPNQLWISWQSTQFLSRVLTSTPLLSLHLVEDLRPRCVVDHLQRFSTERCSGSCKYERTKL